MLRLLRNSLTLYTETIVRSFQTTTSVATERFDHKRIPADDEGVQGEKIIDLDAVLNQKKNIFPTLESDKELHDGMVKLIRSCGMEGFKNTKKGTNIAAQTTGISIATKAIDKGFRTIKVRVRGLGPGRLSAVKGLTMGGLQVVSVTDCTHVSWNPPRPRKARRL
ncbi:unnamed protein product [Leptosia nina]|uniref:28S ribosomal protein S11, mitochondrial n=1 Tax=Leptosia nina TaxID=320188 RepID=A0AAV1J4N0_9NEOP